MVRVEIEAPIAQTSGRLHPAVPVALGRPPLRRGPRPLRDMPLEGPLVDTYGRVHTSMRLSLTDRCNLRCVYCMPDEGLAFHPRAEVLTIDEVVRIAGVARSLGVRSVRLTGGEPLLRPGIVGLTGELSALGFEDIAMTTNGSGLARLAPELARAGLQRVNISCDSLRPDRFARIRRRGKLDAVLEAMNAAEEAGLGPLKVNVVLMAGLNDDEVLEFAAFARETGRVVRFIEFMPLDADRAWSRDRVVTGDEVLSAISAVWRLERIEPGGQDEVSAPAERFRFVDGPGEIGLVSSVSRPFCGSCDRLRLTADGAVRNCLFSDDELSARDTMRSGGSDDDLALLLRRSVWGKLPGHGINEPSFLQPRRSMSMIGG